VYFVGCIRDFRFQLWKQNTLEKIEDKVFKLDEKNHIQPAKSVG